VEGDRRSKCNSSINGHTDTKRHQFHMILRSEGIAGGVSFGSSFVIDLLISNQSVSDEQPYV